MKDFLTFSLLIATFVAAIYLDNHMPDIKLPAFITNIIEP